MIHLVETLPRQLCVACSGGVDSMAAVDFLRRCHTVTVLNFDHGTSFGGRSQRWLAEWCRQHQVRFESGSIQCSKPSDQSWEEHWRIQRYQWMSQFAPQPVVTAHHLDDAVETYLFNALHGKSYTMPYRRGHVIRPFLVSPKAELRSWCVRKGVEWLEDPSNAELDHARNRIRHRIMPEALQINPGLSKVVRRMITNQLTLESIQYKV